MKKWEYVCWKLGVVEIKDNPYMGIPTHYEPKEKTEYDITVLGREGWELVAVHNGWGYFKRPIEE